ncbi:hypothetical protein E2320_002958 [Naja naja]|nr:hypothetical protein E2320_002958 [Naja naja]
MLQHSHKSHAFHHQDQAEVAALHCDFNELDNVLLDRLVSRLRDICIQHRLLAKQDVTLQAALDKACTAKLSNKSTVKNHGGSSPTAGRKAAAVHHEEASNEDNNSTGEDDIHRLKTASGNKWPISKIPQAQTCIGCRGNHPLAACRFKTANCQRCRKRSHLARMCRAILPYDRVQAKPAKGTFRKFPKQGEDCFTIQRDNYPINHRIGQTNLFIKKKKFLTVKIGQNC